MCIQRHAPAALSLWQRGNSAHESRTRSTPVSRDRLLKQFALW